MFNNQTTQSPFQQNSFGFQGGAKSAPNNPIMQGFGNVPPQAQNGFGNGGMNAFAPGNTSYGNNVGGAIPNDMFSMEGMDFNGGGMWDSLKGFGSGVGDSFGFGEGGMFEGTDIFGDGGVMGGIGSIAGLGMGINSAVQAGKQYKNQLAMQDYMISAANEDRKGQYALTNDHLRDRGRADNAAMGRADKAAGKENDREVTQLEYKPLNI